MKSKIIIFSFVLTALLLIGCGKSDAPESVSPSTVTETPQPSPSTEIHSTQNAQNTSEGTNIISEEEAKQIALAHAGLTTEQITFIESSMDRDYGREHYDVEFYTHDQKEYDYEIDPYTGEILDVDYDAEPIHE